METVLNMRVTSDQRAQVFADLMERNRSKSVHYVRRALRCDMDTAEDIAQDAFALAYEKLDSFREEAAIDSWFFTILTRRIHHYRRWRGVREKWRAFIGAAETHQTSPETSDPPLQREIDAGSLPALHTSARRISLGSWRAVHGKRGGKDPLDSRRHRQEPSPPLA